MGDPKSSQYSVYERQMPTKKSAHGIALTNPMIAPENGLDSFCD
jgi:hypothetical protein